MRLAGRLFRQPSSVASREDQAQEFGDKFNPSVALKTRTPCVVKVLVKLGDRFPPSALLRIDLDLLTKPDGNW